MAGVPVRGLFSSLLFVTLLCLVANVPKIQTSFVAYYPLNDGFDSSANRIRYPSVYAGSCPQRQIPSPSTTDSGSRISSFLTNTSRFGIAQGALVFRYSNASMNLGNYLIQNDVSSSTYGRVTISMWVKVNSLPGTSDNRYGVLAKGVPGSTVAFELSYERWRSSNNNNGNSFYCSFRSTTNSQIYAEASGTDSNLNAANWNYVTCIFTGGYVYTFINGTQFARSSQTSGVWSERTDSVLYLGAAFTGNGAAVNMAVHDIKIWNHALSSSEINSWYNYNGIIPIPAVDVTYNNQPVTTTQVVINEPFAFSTALRPNTDTSVSSVLWGLTYLTNPAICGAADLTSGNSASTSATFNRFGAFRMDVCVIGSARLISATNSITITVNAKKPVLLDEGNSEGTISEDKFVVPGSVLVLQMVATANPFPTYRWEFFLQENDTLNSTTTFRRYLEETGHQMNLENESEEEQEAIYERIWSRMEEQLFERAISGNGTWTPIPGANSSILQYNIQPGDDGKSIRGVATNPGGDAFTPAYTISFVSPSTTDNPADGSNDGGDGGDGGGIIDGADSSDGDDNTGLIAGVVAGVVGGLCLICLILLVILLIIFLLRRSRVHKTKRKLAEPDYDELAFGRYLGDEGVSAYADKANELERLEEFLVASDPIVMQTILINAPSDSLDNVGPASIYLFEYSEYLPSGNDGAVTLLKNMIAIETNKCKQESTLFRSNSPTSKMFTTFTRMIALPFIWKSLVLFVNELNDTAIKNDHGESEYEFEMDEEAGSNSIDLTASSVMSFKSMEVNPDKLEDESDARLNVMQLRIIAEKLFNVIMHSCSKNLPEEIREILRQVRESVDEKFDQNESTTRTAMGGFLFLRFICPAIMAPQVWGLLDSAPHPVAHRQLVLLAKVLQNLANGTLPGKKEKYMEKLDEFITDNVDRVKDLYDKVLSSKGPSTPKTGKSKQNQIRENALVNLKKYLKSDPKVIKQLNSASSGTGNKLQDILEEID